MMPGDTSSLNSFPIISLFPNAFPGEPIFLTFGGRGLVEICDPVSVKPIVSIIGILKRSSNLRCISGESGAEADLAKRKKGIFAGIDLLFRM